MSRSIGFVCADLLPLLLESAVAPYREAAVQVVHLAEALRARGWDLAFLTPVAGTNVDSVVPSRLGPAHVVWVGAVPDNRWTRWQQGRRLELARQRLEADLVVLCDARALGFDAPWGRRSARIVHWLTGERCVLPRRSHVAWRRRNVPNLLVPSQALASHIDAAPERTHVLAPGFPLPPAPRAQRTGIAWIGALDPDSGADVLLDMADAFPGCRFDVCSQPGSDTRYAQRFEQRAGNADNVVLQANASYRDVVLRLSTARLLLSTTRTSDLAARIVLAWLHGAALVSLASDPDGLLRRRRLGLLARDPHELYQATRQTLEDDELCSDLRGRAREYAAEHFDIARVAGTCEQIMDSLLHP